MCTIVVVMTMKRVGSAATVCNEGRKVESENITNLVLTSNNVTTTTICSIGELKIYVNILNFWLSVIKNWLHNAVK